MTNVQQFYTSVLRAVQCHVDEQTGGVSIIGHSDKTLTPINVGSKALVMPYDNVLKTLNGNAQQVFHPLCESTVRGESPVLLKLHGLVCYRLSSVLEKLMMALLLISTDKTAHARFNPKQMGLLKILQNVDDKMIENMEGIRKAVDPLGTNRIISVYLSKRPRMDKPYVRATIVSFPFLAQLEAALTNGEKYKVFGQELRKTKDYQAYKDLVSYILPGAQTKDHYSAGSNNDFAPFFDSLVRCFIKVQKDLNNTVELFKDFLPDHQSLISDLSWEEDLGNYAKMRAVLPVFDGNIGDNSIDDKTAHAVNNAGEVKPQGSIVSGVAATVTPPANVQMTKVATPMGDVMVAVPKPPEIPKLGADGHRTNDFGDKPNNSDEIMNWSNMVTTNAMMRAGMMPVMPMQPMPGMYPGYPMQMPMQQMPGMNPMLPVMQNTMPVFQTVQQQPVVQQQQFVQNPMMPMQQMPGMYPGYPQQMPMVQQTVMPMQPMPGMYPGYPMQMPMQQMPGMNPMMPGYPMQMPMQPMSQTTAAILQTGVFPTAK